MSSIDRSYGFIAVLENPMSEDQREDFQEKLWEDESCLHITYNGHCVYYDFNTNGERDDIFFTEVGHSEQSIEKFEQELLKYNLLIKPNTTKPFNCIYYNGSDNPITMLTVEQVINNYRD